VNNIADFFTKALPDTYTVIFDKFTHEKVTPVDMLHAAMVLGVVGYVDTGLVVHK
jgi:hypothetical protein